MRPILRRAPRGLTLLEMLIAVTIITLMAVSTCEVLGNAKVTRERARQRTELALLAQSELERMRAAPAGDMTPGESEQRPEGTPASVSLERRVTAREDGLLELEVTARRAGATGEIVCRLTTLREGAGQ